jgi:hypothetical protein
MCATVFGASSGYVSISITPFEVSSTMIGPAPGDFSCAAAAIGNASTSANTQTESFISVSSL